MSQVIITHDNLQTARDRTQLEEEKISRIELPASWLKSDISHTPLVEKLVGFAFLPIVGIWTFLFGCASVALSLCLGLFQLSSQFSKLFQSR